jgi:nucleotide-binding universal stress UspA family protein
MMWPRVPQGQRPGRAVPEVASPCLSPQAVPAPILVGVDGSAASLRALEWATVRALAGHTSLHIVHVVQIHVWMDPSGFVANWYVEPLEVAQRVLDEAICSARWRAPLLQISTRLRDTDPARALLDEGRTAELIVLGRGHWPRVPWWLHRSVPIEVARRARGRVVIVGPDDEVLV